MSNPNCVPCGQRSRNMQAPPAQQSHPPVQRSPVVRTVVSTNVVAPTGPRMGRPRHFINGTQ
jgi:hypothetical protein